ncbi:MAG: hypothetical protein H3C51_00555 [Rubellimicrobium sp.]|nr:hypothetical protein [Rubellimicrobium sp.]
MHEDRSSRPITDAELETVVGGAAADNAVIQEFYQNNPGMKSGYPSVDGIPVVLIPRLMEQRGEVIESLVNGNGGPRGSPGGITDDQGEDGH